MGRAGAPGIIPARAGFTTYLWVKFCRQEDHPRSRGVYDFIAVCYLNLAGSSPLARGLRSAPAEPTAGARIIPARAGFTLCRGQQVQGRQDHPRSRGVYPPLCLVITRRPGSSPLARGLRCGGMCGLDALRIIPARAGFTLNCISILCTERDHPRSRGVYVAPEGAHRQHGGSSPLARGLHQWKLVAKVKTRIIPARAGFT